MVRLHLKRIATPKTWPLHRKENVFVKRPHSGAQQIEYAVPLSLAIRDMLGVAETMKEVKYILKNQIVSVNGNRVYDEGRTVGFLDILGFQNQKKYFRLLINSKGTLFFAECPEKEKNLIVGKIVKKTVQAKNVITAHLNNGHNIAVKDKFNVGDTIVLERKKNKYEVAHILPYAEKNLAYVFGGKNIGTIGTITAIKKQMLRSDRMTLKVGDKEIECVGRQTFIIGKDKPVFTLPVKDHNIQ